jgi:pimeloyl-ACP methyl ester carboxylesterase
MTEHPFTISVSTEQLDALKQKLELARFPDELDDAGWAYGAPLADVKRLVARWTDGYDWRTHEARLNAELPQFTRDILVDGFGKLNIHYVHQRSALETAIPLLFVHGCGCDFKKAGLLYLIHFAGPGSFIEARKITPLLTAVHPDRPSFHVVALSLPGYGFSEAPTKKGFGLTQYAEVCRPPHPSKGLPIQIVQVGNKLMLALGYNEYGR